MDPEKYENSTWSNHYCILSIEKVSKSNAKFSIMICTNLTWFSSLWNFFGKFSIRKHHRDKMFVSCSNFYHTFHVWKHEAAANLIIFWSRSNFIEFKYCLPPLSSQCFITRNFEISFELLVKISHYSQYHENHFYKKFSYYFMHFSLKIDLYHKNHLNEIN